MIVAYHVLDMTLNATVLCLYALDMEFVMPMHCQCELGYTGDACQFKCPGFEDGDKNVCSGHGTCLLNEIDIVKNV